MKKLILLCAISAAALMASACNTTPNTHDADVKALQDNEAQWNQDWAAKDMGKVAAHYAEDAVLMIPGAPAVTGKDAIQNALKQMSADPALSLQFHASTVEVAKSGDVGFTRGTYTLTMTDSQTRQVVNDHGSYVTGYRKGPDGAWKAVADIAESEMPPPAAPAPAAKKH
jgi:uncharacterized protein (TIGR02246 family)